MQRHLVVNWENQVHDPDDCVELLMVPSDVSMSIDEKGIAIFREEDLSSILATCVYNAGLRNVLSAL